MPCHCAPTGFPDYFVVMQDFGRRGREAVVDPEMTRSNVVSRILTREYDPEAIIFIHHITGEGVEDVTFEIISACAREALDHHPPPILSPSERLAAMADHASDLRKHDDRRLPWERV